LALAGHNSVQYYKYFLDRNNHNPKDIPLVYISYHFYASCSHRAVVEEYATFFTQADQFIADVRNIEVIRKQLSPDTKTDIDEIGAILPNDNDLNPESIPDSYWNAVGGMFAYLVGNLALQGIDILGESQLVGYPTQFPSVSELQWNDGSPNARYWVLKMLIDNMNLGDKLMATNSSDPSTVFGLGYQSASGGTQQLLLINKVNRSMSVQINGISSGCVEYVDTNTGFNPPKTDQFTAGSVTLGPWSVAFVTSKTGSC